MYISNSNQKNFFLKDTEKFKGYTETVYDSKWVKQRLVFNMKYFDEMKYEDISDILGTSVGALKATYHHAVKKIENFLKSKNID